MTRRQFFASTLLPAIRPSAETEEDTLRRLLLSADWSRSFSLAFTDRHGNRSVLDWIHWNDRFALLRTNDPPVPDDYWPPVCTTVYYRDIAEDWLDAIDEVWWFHFGEEWTWGVPASLEEGRSL